jgi:hypothetical protein
VAGLATQAGTVTHANICADISIAMNGAVGGGAGRAMSVNDCPGVLGMSYFDPFRPNNQGNAPGAALINEPGYTECGTTTASFLHDSTLGSCSGSPSQGTRFVANGSTVLTLNFLNTSFTAPFFKRCFSANATSTNAKAVALCNSSSPKGTGDTTSKTFDGGDLLFYDTTNTLMANHTNSADAALEIGNDPALSNAEALWMPLANQHSNGSSYNVFMNGMAQGTSKIENGSPGPGQSCHVNAQDCLIQLGFTPVVGGVEEFCGQTGPSTFYKSVFGAWCVNSASNVLAANKQFVELQEYEGSGGANDPTVTLLGTTAAHMLAYYVEFLLTYQPTKPFAEYSWLDIESHVCTAGGCSGGAADNSINHLSAWPIQEFVPTGTMGIGITAYSQNGHSGAGSIGLAGCTPSENDVGGIQVYLVAGSCGSGSGGDSASNVGVYCNGTTSYTINGGASLGAAEFCVNMTGSTYNSSLCARLFADTGQLGSSFGHQVDIGQPTGSSTFADLVSGGTISTGLSFACGTPSIPSDAGIIAVSP